MENYKKSFKEVYVILQHLTKENFNKIPIDIINTLKENMDEKYNWIYDNQKQLTEQNISRDAVAILSYINTTYLLNKEQKELMEKIHKRNEYLEEEKKKELHKNTNIFRKKISQ